MNPENSFKGEGDVLPQVPFSTDRLCSEVCVKVELQ